MTIELWRSGNDALDLALCDELERLPGTQVRVINTPPVLDAKVRLPFVELPDGRRHYGADSIRDFIWRQG